jgi:hypothetical protein
VKARVEALKRAFGRFGHIEKVHLGADDRCYVLMSSVHSADAAMRALDMQASAAAPVCLPWACVCAPCALWPCVSWPPGGAPPLRLLLPAGRAAAVSDRRRLCWSILAGCA